MDGEPPDLGPRWIPVAAFAAAAAMGAAFFLHARFFNDDALITIRYAENLARGNGLVYNAGERFLGTTTPLWALILAGCAAVGIPATAAATWIGVAAFGWTAAAATLVFRGRGVPRTTQVIAAGLVATSPLLLKWAGSGMETSLAVALLATFLWLFEAERWRALGFVGGAMVLVRPDLGLVLLAAWSFEAMRKRPATTLVRVLPGFAAVVLPWVVAATVYYGTPLPNSGFAKRLQVEDWGTYLGALGPALWAVGPVLPFALIGFLGRGAGVAGGLAPWALVCVVGGMAAGGAPGCGWYLPIPMYLVLVLAAEGAGLVVDALRRIVGAAGAVTAVPAFIAPLLGHVLLPRAAHDAKIEQAQIERLHGRVGTWLHDHAPENVSVGVDNIGYIGWRSGLRVVDMLGLIQPPTAAAIARGERDYALRHERPELVAMWVGRGNTWKYAPDAKWFEENGYKVVFEAPLYDGRPQPAYTVFSRVETRP